ncbi:MAG: sigma-54-dependent Fis family transcriptional regulator [Desulfobacterium sp.]|nr:sigma-54-dependent Fis family transcriptional regulator [Desulfobacterium sp.]MBU3949277.1 response regulator [Pseudomonadota bacterium]MBU4037412.1 response regulator [Pseudomonadota bacterium]
MGRVLIVDDEEGIRDILADYLTRMNLEVATAIDGQDALSCLHKGHFDLIVSDLIMPNMDGLELLKKVLDIDDKIVFIMITGHPTVQTAVEAIKEGAYDYITKPFRFEDVQLRINRAFEKKILSDRLKNSRGITLALLISIPIWLGLGIYLATLLR